MRWWKHKDSLFPFFFTLSFTHWFGQNDTSVRWLTDPLTQSCIHFTPCWFICYTGISVSESYRARGCVHPPKASISSCDLINNNTRVWVRDLYSAAACVLSVYSNLLSAHRWQMDNMCPIWPAMLLEFCLCNGFNIHFYQTCATDILKLPCQEDISTVNVPPNI